MPASRPNTPLLRVFDLRNVIGALLGIYAVLLIVTGFVPGLLPAHHDPAAATNRADLYVGTDANWWVGLALLAVAVIFIVWARLRPVRAQQTGDGETDAN
jgi:H+/Cl- antiporter ClcA